MADRVYLSFYPRPGEMYISREALREAGDPPFVCFLLNVKEPRMLMQACDKNEHSRIKVPQEVYQGREEMEVRSTVFCARLADMMKWDTNASYRVPGRIVSTQKSVCFDLSRAVRIEDGITE